jgi:hypothetical protein
MTNFYELELQNTLKSQDEIKHGGSFSDDDRYSDITSKSEQQKEGEKKKNFCLIFAEVYF